MFMHKWTFTKKKRTAKATFLAYLFGVIINQLMRISWTWFYMLHFVPISFSSLLITIYTRPEIFKLNSLYN